MLSFNDRLATFLQRHGRLLNLIGVLIVFLTFITKDRLRDRWREVADGLETAQYFYSLRVSTTEPSAPADIERRLNLSELGENVRSQEATKSRSVYDNSVAEIISYKKENEIQALRIDNLRILVDKLPHPEVYSPKLDGLASECRALATISAGMGPNVDKMDHESQKDVLELTRSTKDDALRLLISVKSDVDSLTTQVIGAVKAEYEQNKKQAHEADIAAIILYVVGWSLGAVGKIQNEQD